MFPDVPVKCIIISAITGAGAYAMLFSTESERKVYEVAQNMTYIELSAIPQYMDEVCGSVFPASYGRFPVSQQVKSLSQKE